MVNKTNQLILIFLLVLYIPIISANINYSQDINHLKENIINKEYPETYEKPILLTLSKYPELNETRIKFKEKDITTNINTQPGITFALKKEPVPISMASRPGADFIFKKKEEIQYGYV